MKDDPVDQVARHSDDLLTLLNEVVGAAITHKPRVREARAVVEAVVLVDFRLQRITDEIQTLLGADGVLIVVLDDAKAEVVIMSGGHVVHSLVLEAETEPAAADAYCKYCVASRHTFVVTDARTTPILQGNPYINLVQGYLGAPLIINEQAIGALCATSLRPREWTIAEEAVMVERAREMSEILERALGEYHERRGDSQGPPDGLAERRAGQDRRRQNIAVAHDRRSGQDRRDR